MLSFLVVLVRLSAISDLTCYAFADDLTVISSSWDALAIAFDILCVFCSVTDLSLYLDKCEICTKGKPSGTYPIASDQLAFKFYPFLLGSPIDIGTPYGTALPSHDSHILTRAKRIARLDVSYDVAYRLFVSLVASYFNRFALACDMRPVQCASLRHSLASILVPKRAKWVCREAWFSLVIPGHLLSPSFFLDYRRLVEFYVHNPCLRIDGILFFLNGIGLNIISLGSIFPTSKSV